MPIGGGYMGWMEAGQCVTQQLPVYANVPNDGAWYLGAIADLRQSTVELLEDNNARAGTRMGVGSRPDFVVREVTGPASSQLSGGFSASVTLCNQGTYGGQADVDLFLSKDETITPASPSQPYNADVFLGSAPAGWLDAGQCVTQQVPVNANVPEEGAWYLGAVVDPRDYAPELLEDNNARAGTRMGVGYAPDFVVTAVTGPASAQLGGGFSAEVTVCNQGTTSGNADVDLFLSKDEAITPGSPSQPYNADPFLGSTSVGWLQPGQCATKQVTVNANVPADGVWFLGAVVDPRQNTVELLEDNNARAGTRMGVGFSPDFVVQAVTGPASSQMGGSFTASVTVCNQGTDGGHADVELFLSKDTIISGPSSGQPYNADPFVGMAPMGWLQPGQCATQQVPVNAYVPEEGVWYLGAIVDPRNYAMELMEDNNARAGTRMGVGYRPDFVVTAVSGPASVQMGGSFTASVTVCNQGTYGGGTDVELFLSQDATISTSPGQPSNSDHLVGGVYMGWLDAGQCATQQVPVSAYVSNTGTWYLGAISDPRGYQMELLEDNNALAGSTLDVLY
jgi:sulfur relay (sulfurtransferase) complex TusBCD TusD component (DsrE family)